MKSKGLIIGIVVVVIIVIVIAVMVNKRSKLAVPPPPATPPSPPSGGSSHHTTTPTNTKPYSQLQVGDKLTAPRSITLSPNQTSGPFYVIPAGTYIGVVSFANGWTVKVKNYQTLTDMNNVTSPSTQDEYYLPYESASALYDIS